MIRPERFLPQGEAVSLLLEQVRSGAMVHALLISGEAGMGKWTLACGLAAALLCQEKENQPCGKCRACLQMENLSHPDLIVLQKGVPISPDVKKAPARIPVDDIREMIRLTSVHAMEGERHAVLIRHGEDLGPEAQNALLKTLEDPPEGTYFLITSVQTNKILPTIVSRCRPLKLHPWGNDTVLRVLKENGVDDQHAVPAAAAAGGSIGTALRIAADAKYWDFRSEVIHDFMDCSSRSDILKISAKWKDRRGEADSAFSVLEELMNHLMHFSLHIPGVSAPGNDCPQKWRDFAAHAGPADYNRILDGLTLARKRTFHQVNFQATVEQLILMLMEAVG